VKWRDNYVTAVMHLKPHFDTGMFQQADLNVGLGRHAEHAASLLRTYYANERLADPKSSVDRSTGVRFGLASLVLMLRIPALARTSKFVIAAGRHYHLRDVALCERTRPQGAR
jgi:hypothetical protein